MNNHKNILFLLFGFLLTVSCLREYVPDISDLDEVIVVEGLITDQPESNTIIISKSKSLWNNTLPDRLTGCTVTLSDNEGNTFDMKEQTMPGVYQTDPAIFRGVPGREYILHIQTSEEDEKLNFESIPMKMLPVPEIDNIYYEKTINIEIPSAPEGCSIYLDTHDPTGTCKFFRWEYTETWEFRIPFEVAYRNCWRSISSEEILIKNGSLHNENSVTRFPVLLISEPEDRFSAKYSILVKQYSLNEDEYLFWERLNNTVNQTGGLYDQIPSNAFSNIYCVERPDIKVLGYFSVSSVSSKRLFINEHFKYLETRYMKCLNDTVATNMPDTLPGLNSSLWVVKDYSDNIPPFVIYTYDMGCADCRTRGSAIKPSFWDEIK